MSEQKASKFIPFGDPAGLGLAAFALTTFVLSSFNAGLLPLEGEPVVLGLALFYGGLAQLAAGMWEFANRNTFGAVAFTSYGCFWMSFWILVQVNSGATKTAVGLYLFAWGIFTAIMLVGSFRTNTVVLLVFIALTITFFVLAAGAWSGAGGVTQLGGWLGIITALLAWYGALAVVTNSTFKRTVFPVGPLSPEALAQKKSGIAAAPAEEEAAKEKEEAPAAS